MERVSGQRARLAQGRGPDVELLVSGTPYYADYQTLDGYPVVYDDDEELFCYARLGDDDAFVSTGVSVTSVPPPGVVRQARESESVRAQKIEARIRHLEGRASDRAEE